jgi:2-polyprenyl-3-methyl-5-hydroxy-6-metoxy-1,4-benzoquinol methylase
MKHLCEPPYNQPQCTFAVRNSQDVPPNEYDDDWIRETWGWDTPENFIRTQGKKLRPRIIASLSLAALRPGMRILDIGCGRGEVVLHCGRLGVEAVGVDYSQHAIDLAERTRATHSLPEQKLMQFICDDFESSRIMGQFDRIFLLDLVEHLKDSQLAGLFKVCRGLLKPDGAMVIHTLPNKWLYDITYGRIVRLFMPWLPSNPRTEKEMAIHVNEMTITHLARLLKQTGLEQRVWLQDLIVEQALWHKKQPLSDRRGNLYKLMTNPVVGCIYKLLAKTPLRLLIVNEMFAVAWIKGHRMPIKTQMQFTERLIIKMCA